MAAKFSNLRSLNVKLGKVGPQTVNEVRRELQRGSLAIENTAVEGIIESGAARNPGPSLPGEYPAGKSPGGLAQRITSVEASTPGTIRFETGDNVEYGTYLELGTSKMAPRPHLTPAYDGNVDKIKANVVAAVKRGART